MRDIKVSNSCYIPRDQIEMYMSYADNTTKLLIRKYKADEKTSRRIIDLTARKKTGTVMFLKSGKILLVSTSADTIKKRIEDSEA